MGMEMRDPGALAGATGADIEAGRPQDYLSQDATARRHHSAARMLRCALTLGHHRMTEEGRLEAWIDFANVIFLRLTEEERILLAYWTLRTLEPKNRSRVAGGAIWGAVHAK